MAGYRKYAKWDTIPVINTLLIKKEYLCEVDGGMYTYYGEGV